MTEKLKYKFDCAHFHTKHSEYAQSRNCTFVIELDDSVKIKAKVLAHLMQPKEKVPAEHHYQDFAELNVEADVVNYLGIPNSES